VFSKSFATGARRRCAYLFCAAFAFGEANADSTGVGMRPLLAKLVAALLDVSAAAPRTMLAHACDRTRWNECATVDTHIVDQRRDEDRRSTHASGTPVDGTHSMVGIAARMLNISAISAVDRSCSMKEQHLKMYGNVIAYDVNKLRTDQCVCAYHSLRLFDLHGSLDEILRDRHGHESDHAGDQRLRCDQTVLIELHQCLLPAQR
jgi:hypothetical protein